MCPHGRGSVLAVWARGLESGSSSGAARAPPPTSLTRQGTPEAGVVPASWAPHLAAQRVEVVGGRRHVDHLPVGALHLRAQVAAGKPLGVVDLQGAGGVDGARSSAGCDEEQKGVRAGAGMNGLVRARHASCAGARRLRGSSQERGRRARPPHTPAAARRGSRRSSAGSAPGARCCAPGPGVVGGGRGRVGEWRRRSAWQNRSRRALLCPGPGEFTGKQAAASGLRA